MANITGSTVRVQTTLSLIVEGSKEASDSLRQAFAENARPLPAALGQLEAELDPKEFSTGSYGWGLYQKLEVAVAGPVEDGESFAEHAGNLIGQVGGQYFPLTAKAFSTGSCGWHANSVIHLKAGEELIAVRVTGTLTIVGSKEWQG